MRGLEFWKNFTYRVKIRFYNPSKKEWEDDFVKKVNHLDKTFEYGTVEEISQKGQKILTFKLEEAVELMNSMVLNGYMASIEPWFE